MAIADSRSCGINRATGLQRLDLLVQRLKLLFRFQYGRGLGVVGACDLFIGNNSGPLHVAGALGVPTVSVMGPSDPLRFSPRGFADRVLRRELPCSPCRRARCWHHTCLRSIEADEVCEQAEAALSVRLAREEAQ